MDPRVKAVAAPKVLEQSFLEARCKLLDIAAILDRITRGDAAELVHQDVKISRIIEALKILQGSSAHKAEQIQNSFPCLMMQIGKSPNPVTNYSRHEKCSISTRIFT